jgi:uncharacterized membrane protein YfcA
MRGNWLYFGGLLAVGVVVGISSGLFGVGGGTVLIPAMVVLYGQNQQTAQGISLAVMAPVTLLNAIAYFRYGATNAGHYSLIAVLIIGALIAGPYAARFANQLPENTLKILFAVYMVVVAIRIMPQGNLRSMGLLAGVLCIGAGIRLILGK